MSDCPNPGSALLASLLCVYLGVLCGSAVNLAAKHAHHRGAEHAEITQRVELGY